MRALARFLTALLLFQSVVIGHHEASHALHSQIHVKSEESLRVAPKLSRVKAFELCSLCSHAHHFANGLSPSTVASTIKPIAKLKVEGTAPRLIVCRYEFPLSRGPPTII